MPNEGSPLKTSGEDAEAALPADVLARSLVPAVYVPAEAKEMDFVDLVIVFWRWKGMFAGIFFLCVAAAVCIALLRPPAYRYSAMIQLAGTNLATAFQPLVPPAAMANRISNVYAPTVLLGGTDDTSNFNVTVLAPGGANAVVVSTDAPRNREKAARGLLQSIARMAIVADNRVLDAYLQSKRKYLKTQIAQDQARLDILLRQGKGGLASDSGENPANAIYFAGLINNVRGQIANLSEQLDVDLVAGVQRAGLIASVARSAQPVGLRLWVIIVIGVLVGLIAGALAVLAAGLFARARLRFRSEGA